MSAKSESCGDISPFENFLCNFIDSDRLLKGIEAHHSAPWLISFITGIATDLPDDLPKINSLLDFFKEHGHKITKPQLRVLCQYTDLLLDYIIYTSEDLKWDAL